MIGLKAASGPRRLEVAVDLPRPRNQVTTRESAGILRLRHKLYDFIYTSERVASGERAMKLAEGARCSRRR